MIMHLVMLLYMNAKQYFEMEQTKSIVMLKIQVETIFTNAVYMTYHYSVYNINYAVARRIPPI